MECLIHIVLHMYCTYVCIMKYSHTLVCFGALSLGLVAYAVTGLSLMLTVHVCRCYSLPCLQYVLDLLLACSSQVDRGTFCLPVCAFMYGM